jgi:hypothetical protein
MTKLMFGGKENGATVGQFVSITQYIIVNFPVGVRGQRCIKPKRFKASHIKLTEK